MPRSLIFALDQKMILPQRRPAWKVLLYDVRSTTDTISTIVRGLTLQTDTGPLDVTANVLGVQIEEVAGDFSTSGIPSSTVNLELVDDTPGSVDPLWDPLTTTTSPARFLRRGNVIRILEGDADVDPDLWPTTFTGVLVGQAGLNRNRATGRSTIQLAAVSRDGEFANQIKTSDEFQRGAAYLTIATDVATDVMGIDSGEIDFFGWGTQTAGVNQQFVEQSPLVSIAQLMFPDGFLPRFDGLGILTQTSAEISKAPSRIYLDLATLREVVRPFSDLDPVNEITIVGLNPTKKKIVQQRQPLASVTVTTGYFTPDEEINAFWSDDHTVLAQAITLEVQRSINGGLSGLGGAESFSIIPAEGSPPGLSTGAILELATGFAPYIIVILTVIYVILAAIPDAVLIGVTMPIGRIVQAISLAAALIIMTKIGRGQYVFSGEPIEYVFEEIRAIADLGAVTTEELRPLEIRNHLIQTQSNADTIARVELFRQQARGNPRTILALHDLRLEPHDVFEIPGGRRFLIESIARRLIRGAPTEVLATYSTFEVTSGLVP